MTIPKPLYRAVSVTISGHFLSGMYAASVGGQANPPPPNNLTLRHSGPRNFENKVVVLGVRGANFP